MGAAASFQRDEVVEIPERFNGSSYTVQRSSGEIEHNWSISPKSHYVRDEIVCTPMGNEKWAAAHAGKRDGEIRILMYNSIPNGEIGHACGWRRLRHVSPSGFNLEQAENWRTEFADAIEQKFQEASLQILAEENVKRVF
jgi:hypothetical protein